MFLITEKEPHQLALIAIGFQLSVEIARYFNMAIRWGVNVENNMVYF
jgi:hypothetical protein